jgi:phenylpropionate dioxygenase-like ring-hydroxylating dioxygenase large terminal subunit
MTIDRSAAYTDAEAFRAEVRSVFATEWLPIALGAQIPVAGDYAAYAIGDVAVFAVRGADGTVRTFRNACRHHGMPVVERQGGRCADLRCRGHDCIYDLAGGFVSAPAPRAPADPGAPGVHLALLATATLFDIVLFSQAAAPAPAALGEIAETMALELGGRAPRYAGAITTDIDCNWKVRIEHALAAPADTPAWQWPLLLARPHAAGMVVEQVVPLTFLRTRVVAHLLVPACNNASTAALLQAEMDATRAACVALQTERAAGNFAPAHARVATFHDRLAAAGAAAPVA